MARSATALLCTILAGTTAQAEEPLSAIDWLSESVTSPIDAPPPPSILQGPAPVAPIEVSPLDAPSADAAGLLSPATTGLPRDLWGPATAGDASDAINAVPRDLSTPLTRLFISVLLAEAVAPAAKQGDDDSFLLARVDRLLELGALDRAAALLDRAGHESPDRFRRSFDVALLRGEEQAACARMKSHPEVAPTYPARIFCLARNGDWQAAAVTLETANTLGILTPQQDLLLARFLDPEIQGDAALSPDRRTPTPLAFRMMEAVGEPMSSTDLPLAFAWADLRDTQGWKARLTAGERLARAGVLSPNQLIGLYLERRPSASGGVWDRAAAVQALDRAVNAGDVPAVADILRDADVAMREAGLRHVIAEQYGARLATMPFSGELERTALTLGLLSSGYSGAAATAQTIDRKLAFAVAVARGIPNTVVATDPVSLAVRQGFTEPLDVESAMGQLIANGRIGEAVLKAITLLSEGAAGDPDGISTAIAGLRAVGLEEAATRAALDLILADAG